MSPSAASPTSNILGLLTINDFSIVVSLGINITFDCKSGRLLAGVLHRTNKVIPAKASTSDSKTL